MKYILSLFLFIGVLTLGQAQTIFGKWVTIDDETKEKKSVVEIYEENGIVYGKILKLYRKPDEDPDPVCKECDEDDPRYMKKITGMVILEGMKKSGKEYKGGTILKPSEGTVYDCKIWREGDKLMVRGYVAFFYKTQEWLQYTD